MPDYNLWSSKDIRYFKKEAIRYKELLSYQSYISIYNPKNIFQALVSQTAIPVAYRFDKD